MNGVEEVVQLIRNGQRFLLTCHVLPDPDAVGSMLGLGEVLKSLGKEVVFYNRDPIPDLLNFLPGVSEIRSNIPPGQRFDATLITDTAARSLLPRTLPTRAITGPRVVIDHHLVHDDFGDIVIRNAEACATAVVVIDVAKALGVDPLPRSAAEPLYTALVADTGNFRYSGTTPATLRLAATLLESGIDPWRIASQVFENWPMERLRLLGLAINAIETEFTGRVAILCVPQSMLARAGASERMVDGMVEYGRMIRGVEISIMLWERRPRSDETDFGQLMTRMSLRSAGAVDVSSLAAALGGGGHRVAAGATLTCDLRAARELVLAEAGRALARLGQISSLIHGIVVCDKPAGHSSHAVVALARRAFDTRRVGHAGTLDPMATGVLVLAVGEGLKILRYLTLDDKRYEARIALGSETDTLDVEGSVTESAAVPPGLTLEHVRTAARAFEGVIVQRAPAISAIKQGGVPLYARVRAGETVQAPERSVTVHALEVRALVANEIEVHVHCGKGFYVRSLARDLARALGTRGHLSALRRTQSGQFEIGQSVAFAQLTAAAAGDPAQRALLARAAIPLERALGNSPRFILDTEGEAHARNGRAIPLAHVVGTHTELPEGAEPVLLCSGAGELLALARFLSPELRVVRGLRC